MKIDYIFWGGNDLNAAPRKTKEFPEQAEKVFVKWVRLIDWNPPEYISYVEVPISSDSRLFVRLFREDKRQSRRVCYYVGLLIRKADYVKAGEYYLINRGLLAIDIDKILDSDCHPITLRTKWPCPKKAIWKPFNELEGTELVGSDDDAFKARLEEMCFSLSVHNIDDWFERLSIAVNPQRRYPEINYFLSRTVLSSRSSQREPATQKIVDVDYVEAPPVPQKTNKWWKWMVLCALLVMVTAGTLVNTTRGREYLNECRLKIVVWLGGTPQNLEQELLAERKKVMELVSTNSLLQQKYNESCRNREAFEMGVKSDLEAMKVELKGLKDFQQKNNNSFKAALDGCSGSINELQGHLDALEEKIVPKQLENVRQEDEKGNGAAKKGTM